MCQRNSFLKWDMQNVDEKIETYNINKRCRNCKIIIFEFRKITYKDGC